MKLSFIVLTHNSQDLIDYCLKNINWADEIVIFDDASTDKTINIAKKYTSKIYSHKLKTFADQRNRAFKKATGDWVFFLDIDERISQKLKKEILAKISSFTNTAFKMKRLNFFLGKKIKHGGFWPDWQPRLYKRSDFVNFTGDTHETPHFKGTMGNLDSHLIHFTHKNLLEGLQKSMIWTKQEAQAFIKANHPSIAWWRLPRVMLTEFFYRYVKKQGFRDGYVGFVEAIIQAINKFFIYQQIWEMQQQPSLEEQYHQLEKKLE